MDLFLTFLKNLLFQRIFGTFKEFYTSIRGKCYAFPWDNVTSIGPCGTYSSGFYKLPPY